jgi:hypothetical protein
MPVHELMAKANSFSLRGQQGIRMNHTSNDVINTQIRELYIDLKGQL